MKNINHVDGKKNPKIYSFHLQKGGVGKTSIPIAIAGLEAIFNGGDDYLHVPKRAISESHNFYI